MAEKQDGAAQFARAVDIMARLRGEGGCPWDRDQTFDTIKRYTLEETYEVLDAIERCDWPDLKDELGDLLLQVLFYSQMAAEAGHFDISDVVANLNAKLIRRHPHVFGDIDAVDSEAVLKNWEAIKQQERADKVSPAESLLDSVPRNLPALIEAEKLAAKAAKVGFDWPTAEGVFEKMQEEISELHAAVVSGDEADISKESGDLLFTASNLARKLKVDSEMVLRSANAKFRARFAGMEVLARERGLALKDLSGDEFESLWSEVKRNGVGA
jgi:XTP/dITP diphosphohydrolase/ATP diphosphatase